MDLWVLFVARTQIRPTICCVLPFLLTKVWEKKFIIERRLSNMHFSLLKIVSFGLERYLAAIFSKLNDYIKSCLLDRGDKY